MKKWIGILLFIALLALLINDFGRSMRALYDVNNGAREVAQAGAAGAGHGLAGRTSGLSAAREAATPLGVDITAYQADPSNGVTVVVRMYVPGTWVVGPYLAWRNKQPLSTPFPVESEGTAPMQ